MVLTIPLMSFLRFKVPSRPRLVAVDKSLKLGGFIMEPEFVIFDTDDGPRAVSRTCTHLGCRLNYHELAGELVCPCHQSRFTKDGQRLAGPAVRNLPMYPVTRMNDLENKGFMVAIS
ncbi:MAG: Rieske (2Fe-2S) protein [Proteobacteria bacterium]|nr:Rieske (2Fe-2S) protein [Pseudomonadota bacterium]MBU1686570.1 Rieske (2Fe-2S) protein [Pseudomonadota bacterium]